MSKRANQQDATRVGVAAAGRMAQGAGPMGRPGRGRACACACGAWACIVAIVSIVVIVQ